MERIFTKLRCFLFIRNKFSPTKVKIVPLTLDSGSSYTIKIGKINLNQFGTNHKLDIATVHPQRRYFQPIADEGG